MTVQENINLVQSKKFKQLIDNYVLEMINQMAKIFYQKLEQYDKKIDYIQKLIINLQQSKNDQHQNAIRSINQTINKIQQSLRLLLEQPTFSQITSQNSQIYCKNVNYNKENSKSIRSLNSQIKKLVSPKKSKLYNCQNRIKTNNYIASGENRQFLQEYSNFNSKISLKSDQTSVNLQKKQKTTYMKEMIQNLVQLIKDELDCKLLKFHLKNALLKVQKIGYSQVKHTQADNAIKKVQTQSEFSVEKEFQQKSSLNANIEKCIRQDDTIRYVPEYCLNTKNTTKIQNNNNVGQNSKSQIRHSDEKINKQKQQTNPGVVLKQKYFKRNGSLSKFYKNGKIK